MNYNNCIPKSQAGLWQKVDCRNMIEVLIIKSKQEPKYRPVKMNLKSDMLWVSLSATYVLSILLTHTKNVMSQKSRSRLISF